MKHAILAFILLLVSCEEKSVASVSVPRTIEDAFEGITLRCAETESSSFYREKEFLAYRDGQHVVAIVKGEDGNFQLLSANIFGTIGPTSLVDVKSDGTVELSPK